MKKESSTTFKVRLLAKPHGDLQEGFIQLWKHKGVLQNGKDTAFDHLDELPRKIRHLLREAGITWPEKNSK
jgi:hypothetical protein